MQYNKILLGLTMAASLAVLAGCGGSSSGGSSSGGSSSGPVATLPFDDADTAAWFAAGANNVSSPSLNPAADFVLGTNGFDVTAAELDLEDANFSLTTAMGGALDANFVETNYIGAFPQNTAADSANDWTSGWTIAVNGNDTVWVTPANETGTTLGDAATAATEATDDDCPATTTDAGDKTLPGIAQLDGVTAMDVCTLPARISADLTLTNDHIYVLNGSNAGTFVGDGDTQGGATGSNDATLTIEAGTLILGGDGDALVITRDSAVAANGTATAPIVMGAETWFDGWIADANDTTENAGAWAGFALMGNAQSNEGTEVIAEGGIGYYAGTDDADSSGSVSYVVIRDAGNDIDGNGNELNAFTLFGVGSGTSIDHVQAHNGLDDGVEHFGSTDHMTYVVLTDNQDDSFDWGQGYRGSAQFGLVMQTANATAGNRMIEADNEKNDTVDADGNFVSRAEPVSKPVLANFTFISDSSVLTGGGSTSEGILMRRGTGFEIYNSVMEQGQAKECMEIDGDTTWVTVANSLSAITQTDDGQMVNTIFRCADATVVDSDSN